MYRIQIRICETICELKHNNINFDVRWVVFFNAWFDIHGCSREGSVGFDGKKMLRSLVASSSSSTNSYSKKNTRTK